MQKLVEEGQIDFGGESSIKVNMDKLVDQLKRDSLDFKRGHRSGMPATSKKYKWLHKLVSREAKKENGQDQDEDAEQLDVESMAGAFWVFFGFVGVGSILKLLACCCGDSTDRGRGERPRQRPRAAACANSGRRGIGRFPRKMQTAGTLWVACG